MGDIPSYQRLWFFDRLWFAETIKVVTAAAGTAIAIIAGYADGKPLQVWSGVIGSVLLILMAAISIRAALRRDDAAESKNAEMLACLHTVYGAVLAQLDLKDDEADRKLRAVIHKIDRRLDVFEQATPYVGHKGGEPGRKFSLKCGVVGRCAQVKKTVHYAWHGSNIGELIKELQGWGYSEHEAEQMVKMQRSWLASPIFSASGDVVIGVVYMDSIDPDLFTETIKTSIAEACHGIRLFVHR